MEKIQTLPEERIRIDAATGSREYSTAPRLDFLGFTALITLIAVMTEAGFLISLISGIAFFAALRPFTMPATGRAQAQKGGSR